MSRHDCRDHLPPAATDGSVAQCPSCEAWWQYLVAQHEMGAYRRWRRVRWFHFFAVHAVRQEIARRALYEARINETGETR